MFRRPASLALLVGVLITAALADASQRRGLAYLLAVIPVVRLLLPRLPSRIRILPVALIASVLIWQLFRFLQVPIWIKRDLLAVLCLAVAALFWRLGRAVRREQAESQRAPAATRAVIWRTRLVVTALLANIFGYFRLADLLSGTWSRSSGGPVYRFCRWRIDHLTRWRRGHPAPAILRRG
jgi:hypothetical protein